MRSGRATFTVSGDVKGRFSLPLMPPGASTWNAGTGDIALSYLDRSANAVLLAGNIAGKSASTSTTLTLSFVIQDPSSIPFPSSRGECKVSLANAGKAGVSGAFTCTGLKSVGNPSKTIKVAGRFSAAR